jgi:uncharacterized membrane protein (DUF4010 family)
MNYAPIRKLVVGAVTYGAVLGARKALHVNLASDTVSDVVNGALGFAAAYAMRDPRVRTAQTEAEHILVSIQEHPQLVSEVASLAQEAIGHRAEMDKALAALAGSVLPGASSPVEAPAPAQP